MRRDMRVAQLLLTIPPDLPLKREGARLNREFLSAKLED